MKPKTIADIAGDNAAHQLSVTSLRAKWVNIAATGGALRHGDSNVAAARGANVAQNTSVMYPPDGSDITAAYDLTQIYVYVPTGATASITYA